MEHNPPPVLQNIYDVSTGPVGQATATGVQVPASCPCRLLSQHMLSWPPARSLHAAPAGSRHTPLSTAHARAAALQVAAKVTVTAATTAVRVAAPVGKWAVKEGFKAAVSLVSYAMEQERQNKRRKQEGGGQQQLPTEGKKLLKRDE